MDGQSEFLGQSLIWLDEISQTGLRWLTSPAAWSQFTLLAIAFALAYLLRRKLSPVLTKALSPAPDAQGPMVSLLRFALLFLPLLLPLLAFGLTAIGEGLTRSLFGSGDVIAFGKRVFIFIAARILVRDILADGFLKLLGKYILIPVAALYALGLLDDVGLYLEETAIDLGDIRFSAMGLIRGVIAGAVLFWLGTWSNRQSTDYIKSHEQLRPATRELATKAAEVAIFGFAFLLLMSIIGIDLTGIAVLGGALGVGIGLGLQQIAANFVSGVILLIEGQTTVGDYVELDDGSGGTIVRMTARACIIETVDGRWLVVPNDNFITSRVVNYSDAGTVHRYTAEFTVGYDADLIYVAKIVTEAVQDLPFVLREPKEVEVELQSFGDRGAEFGAEFWVAGIDDLTGKYISQVNFTIWKTLKAHGIDMPVPHRVVELRQPAGASV